MNAARSGRLIIFMYLFTAFHHLARKKQGEQRDITICCETILSHKPGRFYFKLALPSVCLHKPWHLLHLERPELQSWNLWNVPGWWGSHRGFAFALGSGAHTGISPFPFQDVKAPRGSGWVWLSSPHCHWIFNWIFISTVLNLGFLTTLPSWEPWQRFVPCLLWRKCIISYFPLLVPPGIVPTAALCGAEPVTSPSLTHQAPSSVFSFWHFGIAQPGKNK